MTTPTPTCTEWGWETPSPSDEQVEAAATDLSAVMVADGWYWNAGSTLLIATLNKKVARLSGRANIATHATVAWSDLVPIAKQALIDGKDSPSKALEAASVPHHVTVEYDDPGEGGNNPRYWSGTQR
ncbi:MAG: hypothetical protein QOI15_2386 [Pseudonocardiales bacterium]|nr:hypothetical protein [Pseudonocardiales bacterium]